MVAVSQGDKGQVRTIGTPITHAVPVDPSNSLEIRANVCKRFGLDSARHWIHFDELNRFTWPGYDLRPKSDGTFHYCMLQRGLFEELRNGIVKAHKARLAQLVARDV